MAGKKKTRAAVTLGKLRAASLTPERRKEIAQKAAATRWNKKRQQEKGQP